MFEIYLLICVYNIIIFSINKNNKNQDIFEILEEVRETIEEMRQDGKYKLADIMENIVESALQGNKIPVYMFMFLLSCTPIVHIIVAITLTKNCFNIK